MALIKCPKCGNKVSDTATACPNCSLNVKQWIIDDNKKKQEKLKASIRITCPKCM